MASVTVEYPQAHPVLERLHSNEGDILVLGGAGISASDAGIANWWSAASGSRLDVFSLDSFRRDPLPFARLAKKLWPVDKKTYIDTPLCAAIGVERLAPSPLHTEHRWPRQVSWCL